MRRLPTGTRHLLTGGAAVDELMERAVHDGLIPGGVVLIGHNGQVVYQKAYGSRALVPQREPMTLFDTWPLS